MHTFRKRHLRKRRFFILDQPAFAIFNASNVEAKTLSSIRASLEKGQLYFMPKYLNPPKLAAGCPFIIVVYQSAETLRKNIEVLLNKTDCLGVSLNKKWYPLKAFENRSVRNQTSKMLSLLVIKQSNLK